MRREEPVTLSMKTPLLEVKLKGLGARSKEKLIEAGILAAGDLLGLLPRDYLNYGEGIRIIDAPLDETVHIRGRILSVKFYRSQQRRMAILEALVDDGDATLRVIWFNQPYLKAKLEKGKDLHLFGKIKMEKLGRTMHAPKFSFKEPEKRDRIKPVYKQVGGLRIEKLAGWIRDLIEQLPEEETLPPEVLQRHRFPTQREALIQLHFPADAGGIAIAKSDNAPARRRLVMEEFMDFQVRMRRMMQGSQQRDHTPVDADPTAFQTFLAALPFDLTGDQTKVLTELMGDMVAGKRLHALIQGDVGCGKTLVGLALAHQFIQQGFQVALLCPTQILAEQHARTAASVLGPLGVRSALFTSAEAAADLRPRQQALAAGELDLAVGTHKLFSADMHYHRLGLVLIDEQHRFGVEQRRSMLKKGATPHYLAFSATPIPRSLAMTLYGDYQVLQIKEKPAQRAPVVTRLKKEDNRTEVIRFAKQRLAHDETVFWVFPLIEGDEEQLDQSAVAMHEQLSRYAFPDNRVGLVHGRLDKETTARVTEEFRAGQIQVLVATTVIEVGVDIPDASIMVIEQAHRFGLSQLHQLRGRVGRGDKPAACFLMLPGDLTGEAVKRMKLLEKSNDGFEIAAFDLEQRGFGELLGKRQSGSANFRFGDPWRDSDLMTEARELVFAKGQDQEKA